jgi:soluble lytic murein transglycosylase-like protein
MVAVRALVFLAVALWIGLARAEPQSAPSTTESPAASSPGAPNSAAPGSAAPNSPAPNSPAPNPAAASPASANPAAPNTTSPSATSPSATAPGAIPPSGQPVVSHPPTADDICRAVERDAAENEIPVEFFARVIWQESRFNALAVSRKGAQGIAQFMPATADYRGLVDPFDPIESLENSARYLRDLKQQFGNLGLAAAAYNAGPGRVSAWLASRRPLPEETRNYVAIITGWTADEWASGSPPKTSDTTIPQGIPCTRLANLILAPKAEAQRIAAYVPRWGMQLTANWSESKAWATYRLIQKQYAALIGDREPIVIRSRGVGLGSAMRYNIRIADDNRTYLDKFCNKLIAAGGACVVLRNDRG